MWSRGKRLAVNLGAWATLAVAQAVPLPGIDQAAVASLEDGSSWGDPLRVTGLGIAPIVTAYVIVELVAFAHPRWRARRHRAAGRERLEFAVGVVAMLMAAAQAYGVAVFVGSLGHVTHGDYAVSRTVLTLVAATAGLLALARFVSRLGLSNGLAWIGAGSLVASEGRAAIELIEHTARQVPAAESGRASAMAGAVVVVALALTVWLASRVVRSEPSAIPTPASGAFAGNVAASAITMLPMLGLATAPLEHPLATILLAALAALVLSRLFFAQERMTALWGEGHGEALAGAWRRAAREAVAFTIAIGATSAALAHALPPGLDVATTMLVAAVLIDAKRGWDVYAADIVAVRAEQRPYAMPLVRQLLDERDIAMHTRDAATKQLLQGYGPHVPIVVLVPRDRADEAATLLDEALGGVDEAPVEAVFAAPRASPLRAFAIVTLVALVLGAGGARGLSGLQDDLADAPRASLAIHVAADDVDRFAGRTPSAGVDVAIENVPMGPGKSAARAYLSVHDEVGETPEASCARLLRAASESPAPPRTRTLCQRLVSFEVSPEGQESMRETGWRTIAVGEPALFTERDLADAAPHITEHGVSLALTFTKDAGERFAALSEARLKRRLVVVIDGIAESAPVVMERIDGGTLHVTSGAVSNEAQKARVRAWAAGLRPRN